MKTIMHTDGLRNQRRIGGNPATADARGAGNVHRGGHAGLHNKVQQVGAFDQSVIGTGQSSVAGGDHLQLEVDGT